MSNKDGGVLAITPLIPRPDGAFWCASEQGDDRNRGIPDSLCQCVYRSARLKHGSEWASRFKNPRSPKALRLDEWIYHESEPAEVSPWFVAVRVIDKAALDAEMPTLWKPRQRKQKCHYWRPPSVVRAVRLYGCVPTPVEFGVEFFGARCGPDHHPTRIVVLSQEESDAILREWGIPLT